MAATFGLVHERRFYSLHIAHDAAYSGCSPGTFLESLELEECFRTDLEEYDFLGGFLKNKVRWATHDRDTVEVHLYQRQPRLVVAYLYFFVVKPRLKRLLSRFGIRWPSKPRTDRRGRRRLTRRSGLTAPRLSGCASYTQSVHRES